MNDLVYGAHRSGSLSARSNLLYFRLEFDEARLNLELDRLRDIPGAARKAMHRALARTAKGMVTDISRYIRTIAPIRARDVKQGLTIDGPRQRSEGWQVSVHVSGGGVPLIRYDVRPNRQTAMKGRLPKDYKHMTYQLERTGQRHGYKSEEGDHSLFVAEVHGKLGVYYRPGPARGRIIQVYGPTLQFHVAPEETRKMILRSGSERFRKELAHQIEFLRGEGK